MIPPNLLWIMLIIGVVSIAFGLRGAYHWRKPWDAAGALWALLGLVGAIIATLLLHVPGFFKPS
jgi:hypothetical protein